MSQSTITFRIDKEAKQELNKICENLGMTISGALTICSKMIINKRGLPFDVRLDDFSRFNEESLKAIQDVEENKNLSKKFNSVKDLMEDLNA